MLYKLGLVYVGNKQVRNFRGVEVFVNFVVCLLSTNLIQKVSSIPRKSALLNDGGHSFKNLLNSF